MSALSLTNLRDFDLMSVFFLSSHRVAAVAAPNVVDSESSIPPPN